jgi:hypothetical protein
MSSTATAEVKPKRIQRKRTKGWRTPLGVVYVGRPGFWGNPYDADALSLALYRNTVQGIWNPRLLDGLPHEQIAELYQRHIEWRSRSRHILLPEIQTLLRGKDLACWCKEGAPCHADILLELANQ